VPGDGKKTVTIVTIIRMDDSLVRGARFLARRNREEKSKFSRENGDFDSK